MRVPLPYIFPVSFILSIFALQWWQQAVYPAHILIALAVLGCSSLILRSTRKTGALFFGILFALLTVARTTHVPTESTIDTYAQDEYVSITGVVTREPDRRPLQTKYTIAAQSINDVPVEGNVLTTNYALWPQYAYGDELQISGKLSRPEAFEGFAYDNYLSLFDTYTLLSWPKITRISQGKGNPILAFLFSAKETFEFQINRLFPEPHASFLAGLLTGSRKGIPEKITEDFRRTGLTHIIAISGYNITVILAIINASLFFLPMRWRLIPSSLAIITFTLFVGASPPVVRAAIMGILGLLAIQSGRASEVRVSILWTAVLMLAWNPKQLWYDGGFQLSFLAVIGMVETEPILRKALAKIPDLFGLRTSLQATLAAQAFAIPWITLLFKQISLVSPLANILVAPFIPPAMLFGFLGTVCSWISFPLGQALSFISWGCLMIIVYIATLLSKLPGAAFDVPSVSIFGILTWYAIIISLLILITNRKHITSFSWTQLVRKPLS